MFFLSLTLLSPSRLVKFWAQPHSVLYSSKFTFIPALHCIEFYIEFKHCIHSSIAMHSSCCIHVECIPRGNIKSNAALRGSEETGDVGETSSNQDPPSPDLVRSDHFNLCNSSNFFLQCISNQIKFRVKCSPMSRVLTLRSCHVLRAAPVQPYDPWIRATDYSENSPLPIWPQIKAPTRMMKRAVYRSEWLEQSLLSNKGKTFGV